MSNTDQSFAQAHTSTSRRGCNPLRQAQVEKRLVTFNQSPLRLSKGRREVGTHSEKDLRELHPSRESDCFFSNWWFSGGSDLVSRRCWMRTDASNPWLSFAGWHCCERCEWFSDSKTCDLQRYTYIRHRAPRPASRISEVHMRVVLPSEIQPFVRAILKSQGYRGSLHGISGLDERLSAELFFPTRGAVRCFYFDHLNDDGNVQWYEFANTEQKATVRTHATQNTIRQDRKGHSKLKPLVYNHNTHQRTQERHHVRREPCQLPRDQASCGTESGSTGEANYGSHVPDEIEGHDDLCVTHGQLSLQTWKCAAGKSKSWRRVPKDAVSRWPRYMGLVQISSGPGFGFAKAPLWYPAAFLRSRSRKKSPRPDCVVRCPGSEPGRVRAKNCHPYVHGPDDDFISSCGKQHTPAANYESGLIESGPFVNEDIDREPGHAFMRLTWADDTPTKVLGQLDRFLPTGLILGTCWCIERYIRNDNFADVYLLSGSSTIRTSTGTEKHQEAHIFLDKYYGNCENYSKRHESRMKRSKDCLDAFHYGSRRVLIMRIGKKPVLFKLRNTEEEFPTLVNRDRYNTQSALRQRGFRGKPSYAAVVGGRWPSTDHEYRPQSTPESRSRLEKELDQIQRARLKKNERQRAKRRSQRERRVAELWPVI